MYEELNIGDRVAAIAEFGRIDWKCCGTVVCFEREDCYPVRVRWDVPVLDLHETIISRKYLKKIEKESFYEPSL